MCINSRCVPAIFNGTLAVQEQVALNKRLAAKQQQLMFNMAFEHHEMPPLAFGTGPLFLPLSSGGRGRVGVCPRRATASCASERSSEEQSRAGRMTRERTEERRGAARKQHQERGRVCRDAFGGGCGVQVLTEGGVQGQGATTERCQSSPRESNRR